MAKLAAKKSPSKSTKPKTKPPNRAAAKKAVVKPNASDLGVIQLTPSEWEKVVVQGFFNFTRAKSPKAQKAALDAANILEFVMTFALMADFGFHDFPAWESTLRNMARLIKWHSGSPRLIPNEQQKQARIVLDLWLHVYRDGLGVDPERESWCGPVYAYPEADLAAAKETVRKNPSRLFSAAAKLGGETSAAANRYRNAWRQYRSSLVQDDHPLP